MALRRGPGACVEVVQSVQRQRSLSGGKEDIRNSAHSRSIARGQKSARLTANVVQKQIQPQEDLVSERRSHGVLRPTRFSFVKIPSENLLPKRL